MLGSKEWKLFNFFIIIIEKKKNSPAMYLFMTNNNVSKLNYLTKQGCCTLSTQAHPDGVYRSTLQHVEDVTWNFFFS